MSGTENVRPAPGAEFLIQWCVQNLSMFHYSKDNCKKSETFVVPLLGNTKWYLKLVSKGPKEGNILCFLCRSDDGPDNIKALYSISVDSSVAVKSQPFAKDSSCFTPGVINLSKFADDVNLGVSKDVLRIECRLWPDNSSELPTLASPHPVGIVTSTYIRKETRSTFYKISNFSNFVNGKVVEFKVPAACSSFEDFNCRVWMEPEMLRFRVWLGDEDPPNIGGTELTLKCSVHLLDVFGDRLNLHRGRYLIDAAYVWPAFQFEVSKKLLMEKKDLYLPEDELLLHFELSSSPNESWNTVDATLMNESFDLQAHRKVKWGVYLDRKYNDHRLFFRLLAFVAVVLSVLPHLFFDNIL